MIKLNLSDKEKECIPSEFSELALVRKFQLLVSPHLKRNSRFFLEGANVPEKSKAYNTPVSQETLEENVKSGKVTSVVCANLCNLSAGILKENGLNVEVISCDTDIFKHADLLLTTQFGEQYIINILEDLDLIQSFMRTPNFASEDYYKIRYEKFEANNGITTNGTRIKNIAFISPEDLLQIDKGLGYLEKNNGVYMNDVLAGLKEKISDFRTLLIQSEFLKAEAIIERENVGLPKYVIQQRKIDFMKQLQFIVFDMDDVEILSRKLDWIFTHCNDRMNIKGHTDFVMYYSQSLLKGVLDKDEYKKIQRYDGFTYGEQVPEDSIIKDVLDFANPDYDGKLRFSVVQCGKDNFIISTKPNSYIKISEKQLQELKSFCIVNVSEPPSELAINLSFKGHALPLIFHSIGKKLVAEKQNSLGLEELDDEERKAKIEEVARSIETTDEPVTSILIPYEKGNQYIYLDEKSDFVVEQNGKRITYYYNTRTDEFTTSTSNIGNEENDGGRD